MKAEMKPCPFCASISQIIEGYDFGRGFTENIYSNTETIHFECDCGCSYAVGVENIHDVLDKINYAIEKWNERPKSSNCDDTKG